MFLLVIDRRPARLLAWPSSARSSSDRSS